MIERSHEYWMQCALDLADCAAQENEVPVGAVIVLNDEIIGEGWNRPIQTNDPTAHAEIMAMRAAAKHVNNYRLLGSTLYVTLEPCAMCCGAMIHARIEKLVFAADDPKAGAVRSIMHVLNNAALNHQVDWLGGVMADNCSERLQAFFQKRRGNKRETR